MDMHDTILAELGKIERQYGVRVLHAVESGSRLLMMDKGQVVLDRSGEEKKNTVVDDVLTLFNRISIECGN